MSLVNPAPPGGFGVGAELTSAQANQICNQIPLALDKSPAGDQLQGVVTMAPGASIQASVPGGLASTVPGGIALSGGAQDWPTFGANASQPRSRTVRGLMLPWPGLATGWTQATAGLIGALHSLAGPGTSTQQFLQLPALHNGATLFSVTVFFAVFDPHGGGAPQVLPTLSVEQVTPVLGGFFDGTVSQIGVGSPAVPVNGAAWFANGNLQSWTVNVNAVMNTATSQYYARLTDENGINAVAGNRYLGMTLLFNSIADMRFP